MFHLIISADTAEIFVQLFKINKKFCISVHVTYIFAYTLQCLKTATTAHKRHVK